MPPKRQPLTAEEKKKRLLLQRLAKKEKLEESKKQLRRDHLTRELRSTDHNWKTITEDFRKMAHEAQLPWIMQDMETMWHRFDFTIDLKNYVLECVLDELDEDDLQTQYNLASHVQAIDLLIRCELDEVNGTDENINGRSGWDTSL